MERVMGILRAEEGYFEKSYSALNKHPEWLDDKTAGAGKDNVTKYGRDLVRWLGWQTGDTFGIDYQWCLQLQVWADIMAYGVDKAFLLNDRVWTAYTPTAVEASQRAGRWHTSGPRRGDKIYFRNSTRVCHVGRVLDADSRRVYTDEGNTGSAAGVVSNGGCVRQKDYLLTYDRIAGYARPDWSVLDEIPAAGGDDLGVKDPESFVALCYALALNREPDAGGLQAWVNALNSGRDPEDVLREIAQSEEGSVANVRRLYATLLRRQAREDEVAAWDGQKIEKVVKGVLNSDEFKALNRAQKGES